MGGFGLTNTRNIVFFTFDGEQRDVVDFSGIHGIAIHDHLALSQAEFHEHFIERLQIKRGVHVEHGVVLIVEHSMLLGAALVAFE